jgi:hypothetical protein
MYYYNEPTEQEVKKSRERAEELGITLEEYLLLKALKQLDYVSKQLNMEKSW